MTELETRLMDALQALSAQWDVDQQQHAEEQDMLSARVNDLAQQVTDFARQHEQHATALQAQLQQQAEQVERLTEQYAHISADYKRLAELLAQEVSLTCPARTGRARGAAGMTSTGSDYMQLLGYD